MPNIAKLFYSLVHALVNSLCLVNEQRLYCIFGDHEVNILL